MSDDKEKPGVVIDVTPEPEPEQEPRSEQEPTPEETPTGEQSPARTKPSGGSRAPIIIAVLALLLVIAALLFAYQYTRQASADLAAINATLSQSLQQQDALQQQLGKAEQAVREQAQRLQAQQQKVDAQQATFSSAQASFAEQEELLEQERLRMQEREAELRASVADVHKRVGSSGTQWMVAEAEYLARLANNRLSLSRDVATARVALLLADQRLRDTGDPGWNGVRRQFARDITQLDKTNLPDSVGISARLSSLAEQVPQLHLGRATLGGVAVRPRQEEAPTDDRSQRSWDTLLDDLWNGFKETVRIRRNDQPVQAMLPPEQQYFLYENLRLHLEAARLAVARGDNTLYHDSLNTVKGWLLAHFDADDKLTQLMRDSLVELEGHDIFPALPDISQSLKALQIRQKLNADLARPITPAPEPIEAEPAGTEPGDE